MHRRFGIDSKPAIAISDAGLTSLDNVWIVVCLRLGQRRHRIRKPSIHRMLAAPSPTARLMVRCVTFDFASLIVVVTVLQDRTRCYNQVTISARACWKALFTRRTFVARMPTIQ